VASSTHLDRATDLLLQVAAPKARNTEGHRAFNLAVGELRDAHARTLLLHGHYKLLLRRALVVLEAEGPEFESLIEDIRCCLTVAKRETS
jgi:hypothetical protein